MRPYWISTDGRRAEGDLSCAVGHRIARLDGADEGVFAGWRWRAGELLLEQDRYGLFPLFEWRRGDGTRVIATDLLTLLERGAPATLDLDALSVFSRVGFFIGSDTPFAAIRALLPTTPRRPPLQISRTAAVDGFIDLFSQSMARRPPSGPFVLPLSGGRDSRHILFALNDAGHRPDACVTVRHFPPRANDDELVAQEVCATLALEHRVIVQGRERHVLEREKNRATHLCTDEHAQFVVLADYLRVHTPETYDGIGGDVLSQSTYLQPDVHALFRRGDTAGVAAYVLDGYGITMSERALARVLQPAFYREIPRERAVTRLIAEIAGHLDAPNPIGSFFFANRTRREIALAPYALLRDVTVYAPYLDSDLYDFLASLPADLLMDRSLHTDAIARAWPQWAAIPYERKGLRTEDRWAQRRAARAVLRAAWRHSSRRYVRRGTLVPMMLTTIADGAADRLWPASLVWYLDQIADVTAAPIAASARER